MFREIVRLAVILPLVTLIALPSHAGRHDPILSPEPISIPDGKSAEEIRKSVRKALFDDEWETREIAPGRLQAKRSKRGKDEVHTATIEVAYTGGSVRISYKDSQNLNYDAKDKTIHGTYNRWIRNLERRIRKNLGAY